MSLCPSGIQIVGTDDPELRVSYHPERESVRVRMQISGERADLSLTGCPHNNFQARIEIPKSSDLYVRMLAGQLDVMDVTGDKDIELSFGQLNVDVGKTEQYARVDASVNTGQINASAFNVDKGGLFRSFSQRGPGKYRVHTHVGAGEVDLRFCWGGRLVRPASRSEAMDRVRGTCTSALGLSHSHCALCAQPRARRPGLHWLSRAEGDLQHEQAGSDHNGAVGEIEDWPVISLVVGVEKIHHAAAGHPIPKISDRASEDQRERGSSHGQRPRLLPEQERDHDHRNHRKTDQHGSLPLRGRIGKQAERGPGVFRVSDAEKSRDHLDVRVHGNPSRDQSLGPAVKHDHEQGEKKMNGACARD